MSAMADSTGVPVPAVDPNPAPVVKKSPSSFLKAVLGRPVVVRLNNGVGALFEGIRTRVVTEWSYS